MWLLTWRELKALHQACQRPYRLSIVNVGGVSGILSGSVPEAAISIR